MPQDFTPTKPHFNHGPIGNITTTRNRSPNIGTASRFPSMDKKPLSYYTSKASGTGSGTENGTGSGNGTPIVKYVLAAEFDAKVGAVVRQQVPRKIPGFKEHLSTLGELMIPSSSEHTENSYSVFVLYKDASNKYRLLPDTDIDLQEEGTLGFQRMSVNEINTIFEKTSHDDDVLFFLTVTRSVARTESERGRVIRAISLGTPLRNFTIFKHLITLTMQLYIHDGQLNHLVSLFTTINTMDVSLWTSYVSSNPHLYNILSLNYDFNNRLILSHFKNIKSKDLSSQAVKYKEGVLQYFPHLDPLSKSPDDAILAKIPLYLSLSAHPTDIITDINVTRPIMKFLNELSSKLNLVDYKNFNILIYTSSSVDFLTSFILTLSNFLNGFNSTYFHNDRILFFPLIDLYSWEKVLEFDSHTKNSKIIGTNNIILKDNSDFYDFFYDLDTETLSLSEKLQTHQMTLSKTYDFMELTRTLYTQHQDYTTIRLSLQRFNLWEIVKILSRDDTDTSEVNLKDYYLSRNKNIVIFDEFFEYKTIQLIDTISTLVKFLSIQPSFHIPFTPTDLETINSCYEFFHTFITHASVKGRLEMFLYIMEIFPTNIQSPRDLIFDFDVSLQSQSLLSDIFKMVLVKDATLQGKVLRLYNVLNKSSLKIVLEQRLNTFTKVMLEEYSSRN